MQFLDHEVGRLKYAFYLFTICPPYNMKKFLRIGQKVSPNNKVCDASGHEWDPFNRYILCLSHIS
jgi:hypothetical protein